MTALILERVQFRLFLSDLTQNEVERRLGFSKGYLSHLFSGKIDIKYWQFLAILNALDLDPSELFLELFPRRHPALESLEDLQTGTRLQPLGLEFARLCVFGIETLLDLYERLEQCEFALSELVDLGFLKHLEL